ncbi:MAG TPA: inositol monophosphatase family protein, partial [Longimicrobium sp.]|nr:inositol monophosphatase family protein [Longimicrobium sp.]
GTSSFVAGRPEFAVSIGLVERGMAVLGVVHNPVTGETYHAAAGAGACKDGAPIRVSDDTVDGPPRLLASRSDLRKGALVAFADGWRVEPLGSTAYKMARIAEGGAEGFAAFGPRAEWDVCGAAVVLREAGGMVTRLDGAELRFNQPNPSWRGIAGSNGRVHAELLRVAMLAAPGEPRAGG